MSRLLLYPLLPFGFDRHRFDRRQHWQEIQSKTARMHDALAFFGTAALQNQCMTTVRAHRYR